MPGRGTPANRALCRVLRPTPTSAAPQGVRYGPFEISSLSASVDSGPRSTTRRHETHSVQSKIQRRLSVRYAANEDALPHEGGTPLSSNKFNEGGDLRDFAPTRVPRDYAALVGFGLCNIIRCWASERRFSVLPLFRTFLILVAAVLIPLPSEAAEAPDIESAREACRKSRDWPNLPPEVEGCSIDWTDPESISAHVVRPSKLSGPPSIRRPVLPADEKILPGGLFLEYLISEDGKVLDVCVLRSASPSVDEYYVDIAKRTSFTPGRICDEVVPFTLIVTVSHHAWDWPREPN